MSQQAIAESIDYKIYGVYSSVNTSCKSTKLKKSNSDWLNLNSWKSSNNNVCVKRCDFRVSVFCQVVQKLYLGEVEK